MNSKQGLEGFTESLKTTKTKAHHRAHSLVVKRPACTGGSRVRFAVGPLARESSARRAKLRGNFGSNEHKVFAVGPLSSSDFNKFIFTFYKENVRVRTLKAHVVSHDACDIRQRNQRRQSLDHIQ